jgi:hypothetical protein
MATKEEARNLYVKYRKAGYSEQESVNRVSEWAKTGQEPADPTEPYWGKIVQRESRGDQSAVSPAGAIGVAQVMPKTAPEAAKDAGQPFSEGDYRQNAAYNEALGRAYYRKLLKKYDGDARLATAAYNAGPGAVDRAGGDISKLPAETKAYVPAIVQGKGPMTKNDLRAYAAKRVSEGADSATIKAEIQKMVGAGVPRGTPPTPAPQAAAPAPQPAQAQPLTQAPEQTTPLVQANKELWDKAYGPEGNWFDKLRAGASTAAVKSGLGISQVLSSALGATGLGDPGNEARLAQQQQQVEAPPKQYDPAGSGFSLPDAGGLAANAVMGLGPAPANIGAQAAMGAAQSGLQPAKDWDERSLNAAKGAALSGGLTAALKGGAGAIDFFRKGDVADEVAKFSQGHTGYDPAEGNTLQDFKGLVNRVEEGVNNAKTDYKRAINAAEATPDLTPVVLTKTLAKSEEVGGLSDELLKTMSPKLRRVLATVRGGVGETTPNAPTGPVSTRATKQVRTPGGWREAPTSQAKVESTTSPSQVSFQEVRQAQRELKSIAADLRSSQNKVTARPISNLLDAMNEDLDTWAASHGRNAAPLKTARQMDDVFRDKIVPFQDSAESLQPTDKNSLEQVVKKKLYGNATTTGNAGTEVEKILEINPAAKAEMRRLLMADVTTNRGPTATARAYAGGTTAEVLLSPEERRWMRKAADALDSRDAMNLNKGWMRMLQSLYKQTKVLPYGAKSTADKVLKPQLINALRSMAAGQVGEGN